MFQLNALPPQLAPTLVEKLVRAEPATIGIFAIGASWIRPSRRCSRTCASLVLR
jgi:hypothetical protein